MLQKVVAHPRYFLGGHRPSETSILTILNLTYNKFLILDFNSHSRKQECLL